jgi:hypothetical protein
MIVGMTFPPKEKAKRTQIVHTENKERIYDHGTPGFGSDLTERKKTRERSGRSTAVSRLHLQIAYLRVHSRAVASYRGRSVLYTCAISGTSGSSGLGSVSIEQIESNTGRR